VFELVDDKAPHLGIVSEVPSMALIRDVVQKALNTLMIAEEQLRQLTIRYDLEDFNAFMTLQEAARTGQVKQESRERPRYIAVEQCS